MDKPPSGSDAAPDVPWAGTGCEPPGKGPCRTIWNVIAAVPTVTISPWPPVGLAVPQRDRGGGHAIDGRAHRARRATLGRRRRVRPVLLPPPTGGLAGAVRRDVRRRRPRALPGLGPGRSGAARRSASASFEMPALRRSRGDGDRDARTGLGRTARLAVAAAPAGSTPAAPSAPLAAGQARIRRLAISPSIWRSASTYRSICSRSWFASGV